MTPERRTAILLLLGSRTDARHEPLTWTGALQQRATLPGPAPSEWQLCPTCGGDRVTRDRFGRETRCAGCDGKGRRKVDAYTGSADVSVSDTRTTPVRTVPCDACGGQGVARFVRCERCLGSGRCEVVGELLRATHTAKTPVDDRFNDPRLMPEQRWRQIGSYDHLDVALARLAALTPLARKLVYRVYESGELREGDLGPALRRRLEFALRFLDRELPRRLRVPRAVLEAAGQRRVASVEAERIRRMRWEPTERFPDGAPLCAIQVQFGLSRAQVLDVLGRTG